MVDDDLALGTGSGKSSVHEIRIEGKRDILGKEKYCALISENDN